MRGQMTEEQTAAIGKRLNALPWHSAKGVTPVAEELVQQHIERMSAVLDHLVRTKKMSPIDAYSDAQSAGYAAAGHDELFHMLYHQVDYRGTPAKMPVVLSLVSHYFWKADPDLGHLEDPWEPILRLFELGYTTTFDQDDDAGALDVVLEYDGGTRNYPLVGSGVTAKA
jgi:hypothetical protein